MFICFSWTITDKQPPAILKKELHRTLEICSTLAYNSDQDIHLENELSASGSLFCTKCSKDWRDSRLLKASLSVSYGLHLFYKIFASTLPSESLLFYDKFSFQQVWSFLYRRKLKIKFQITSSKLVLIRVTSEKRCCINIIPWKIMARKKCAKRKAS